MNICRGIVNRGPNFLQFENDKIKNNTPIFFPEKYVHLSFFLA